MDVAIRSQLFRKIIIFWRKQNKDEIYFSIKKVGLPKLEEVRRI